MSPSLRPSGFVVEVLRVLVVLFGAAVGLQIARTVSPDPESFVLGALTAPMIGIIIGGGVGYSVGGVVARRAVRSLDRSDHVLDRITAEELVSGSIGALIAAVLTAIVVWPVFLITSPVIALSVFAFAVVLAAAFGFTVGQRRREAVMGVVGPGTDRSAAPRPAQARLIDSSVAIDARFLDVVKAGFGQGRIVVCQPVLDELQQLADAEDIRRRHKGRRGLAMLEELRRLPGIDVTVIADEAPAATTVDGKLVQIALSRSLALLTLDAGLAKVAAVTGVHVQNLHALSLALRPPIAVGDVTTLALIRHGKESGQAVGYLDDGTMVVVEHADSEIGHDVAVEVTSVLTTSNGRMAFARQREAQ